MSDTIELAKRFDIPGQVTVKAGQGNLPMVSVDTKWSSAEIYLHGAHVTKFQKKNEAPLLWLSQKSKFDEKSAIRGGIPVILPWFGGRAGAPSHGVARVRPWELKSTSRVANGAVRLELQLPECSDVAGFGPFSAEFIATVGETLSLELIAKNLSPANALTIEECLHTYFTVGDISAVSVVGLKGVNYLDKVLDMTEHTEINDVIKFSDEVDRVYLDTSATVEIRDEELRRKISVEKENSVSTVVWNPWVEKSKAMADFGDEEYHTMVCVESGNVGKSKVTIDAGQSVSMKVTLSSTGL